MKATSVLLPLLAAIGLSGCATKEYVHEYVDGQVAPVNSELKTLDGRVTANGMGLKGVAGSLDQQNNHLNSLGERVGANESGLTAIGNRMGSAESTLKDQDSRIGAASKTAQDALERASAAGVLAQGKFVYEVAMSDTTLAFDLENDQLPQSAMVVLDAFAANLKSENKNVFIEIQGHTDTTGSDAYNLKLGQARAEAVRRYLNMQANVPLHRMSVISYGESAPIADNKTRAGRMQNRRVVLVVLE